MAREPASPAQPKMAHGMERLLAHLTPGTKAAPPVERWNPPFCGDIDMRIASDGQWFYLGTPIARPALVRLFASVLKREGDGYFLVTPVEKVGIMVDDAPFQAVEMAVDGDGPQRVISFRTNVDDIISIGAGHDLRFDHDPAGGVRPYVHVRRDLWARVTRALTYDLLALGDVRTHQGVETFGVMASDGFFPVLPATALEGLM